MVIHRLSLVSEVERTQHICLSTVSGEVKSSAPSWPGDPWWSIQLSWAVIGGAFIEAGV